MIIYFPGSEVRLHKLSITGKYPLQSGWPKTLSGEYGSGSPSHVTSASYAANTVYLLSGDVMYELSMNGSPLSCTYTLITSYTLTQNTPPHSFSSTSSTAPSNIDTFMVTADLLRARVKRSLYDYDRARKEWLYQGEMTWL